MKKSVEDVVRELGGCEYTMNPCASHEIRSDKCRKCGKPCELEGRCRVCRAAVRILFLENQVS